MGAKEQNMHGLIASNKKALYNYYILDKYTAGIVLVGTEIKSLRAGKVSINDSYCFFDKNELFVRQMFIATYTFGGEYNHNPYRTRKLLLNKNELRRIKSQKDKNMTVVPIKVFLNNKGFAKVEIALAKGKKLHDKRLALKLKDQQRTNYFVDD